MIFDIDILIWIKHGNTSAARLVEKATERYLSILTQMELVQGARNKREHELSRKFLKEFDFQILPLTENIGHRALIYMEQYALAGRIGSIDALIAATAVENNMTLASSNKKHYKHIRDLNFREFKP